MKYKIALPFLWLLSTRDRFFPLSSSPIFVLYRLQSEYYWIYIYVGSSDASHRGRAHHPSRRAPPWRDPRWAPSEEPHLRVGLKLPVQGKEDRCHLQVMCQDMLLLSSSSSLPLLLIIMLQSLLLLLWLLLLLPLMFLLLLLSLSLLLLLCCYCCYCWCYCCYCCCCCCYCRCRCPCSCFLTFELIALTCTPGPFGCPNSYICRVPHVLDNYVWHFPSFQDPVSLHLLLLQHCLLDLLPDARQWEEPEVKEEMISHTTDTDNTYFNNQVIWNRYIGQLMCQNTKSCVSCRIICCFGGGKIKLNHLPPQI